MAEPNNKFRYMAKSVFVHLRSLTYCTGVQAM